MICDYGCGQEATHQFKNGKWCCSKYVNQCQNPILKERRIKSKLGSKNGMYNKKHKIKSKQKMSLNQIGKKRSEEFKRKISFATSGKKNPFYNKTHTKETRKRISKSKIGTILSQETKNKMSKSKTGKNHHMYGKHHSVDTIKKISKTQRRTIYQIKERYPTFAKVEEMRYNPDKPGEKEIQVHCKNHNCKNSKEQGGWFTSTKIALNNRISCIENPIAFGECNLYCSDKCKKECPLFALQPKNNIEHLYTAEEYQTFRQQVLNREDYKCEYCEEQATHIHHSRPQKLEPGFALDPDFGVACCEKCHYKYGHKTGTECSTGNLSKLICEKIIRVKEK